MPPIYLVTGGFGFLGQYIVQALSQAEPQAEVRVQVRTPRQPFLPIGSLPNVRIFQADLNQPAAYATQLEGVQAVIHSAALVSFKPADRQAIYRSNVEATQQLAELCLTRGVQSFVYISSISTVATRPPQVSDESMFPSLDEKQDDPYGHSKLLGEMLLNTYADRLRVVSLNPSVILGPGSERIASLARYLPYIPFVPMVHSLNSFVDVRDTARAVPLALQHAQSGERYILTGWNVDMVDFTRQLLRLAGRHIPVLPVPCGVLKPADWLIQLLKASGLNPGLRPFSRVFRDKAYSNKKAAQRLGWQPLISLEQCLADTLPKPPK